MTLPEPPSRAAGLSRTDPINTYLADVILVGNNCSFPLKNDFPWPKMIPRVNAINFDFPENAVTPQKTRSDAIEAIRGITSEETLAARGAELKEMVTNPGYPTRKAPYVILVGYGYGGLLCERVIVDIVDSETPNDIMIIKGLVLFGTPHSFTGLRQWAHVVIQATMQLEEGSTYRRSIRATIRDTIRRALCFRRVKSADIRTLDDNFRAIAEKQRKFFKTVVQNTKLENRVASCFQMAPFPDSPDSLNRLTIMPHWCSPPFGTSVLISKPYLEMTMFDNENEKGNLAISPLIESWVEEDEKETASQQYFERNGMSDMVSDMEFPFCQLSTNCKRSGIEAGTEDWALLYLA